MEVFWKVKKIAMHSITFFLYPYFLSLEAILTLIKLILLTLKENPLYFNSLR